MEWEVYLSINIVIVPDTDVITFRDPVVITDEGDRIIAILAGQPIDDESFSEVISGTEAVMASVAPSIRARGCSSCRNKAWTEQCQKCRERRGDFKAISVGVSYGGGQTVWVLFLLF